MIYTQLAHHHRLLVYWMVVHFNFILFVNFYDYSDVFFSQK